METPTASAPPSPRRLWWLLVAFAAAYFTSFVFFPGLFFLIGVNHFGVWFLDSYAILASNDALTLGRDVYASNPLDPFGRPHVYSHWWLHLRDLGLTRADNFRVGVAVAVAFLAAAVVRLRPREPRELLWYLVVLCSSPVLLGINRANNDLIVFVLLAPVVPCLLSARRGVRFLAAGLIAFAAGLKFYPAIAGLILLAGDDAREVRLRVLVGLLALALVGVELTGDVALVGGNAPKAEGLMTFSAINALAPFGVAGGRALAAVLALAAIAVVIFLRSRVFDAWEPPADARDAWLAFILGAALLAGCFFTGTNYAYRWVFALWLAPLLWRLPRDPRAPAGVRRLAALTAVLLIVALWSDALASAVLGYFIGRVPGATILRWADRFFLLEQPLTWAFFMCLLGFLAHFVRGGVRTVFRRG